MGTLASGAVEAMTADLRMRSVWLVQVPPGAEDEIRRSRQIHARHVTQRHVTQRDACTVQRAACCVMRAACTVLRAACTVLRVT